MRKFRIGFLNKRTNVSKNSGRWWGHRPVYRDAPGDGRLPTFDVEVKQPIEHKQKLIKEAKYGIRKPKTCRATLLRFKFLVDVSRFSPCGINFLRNKCFCCVLKKCRTLIG